MADRPRLRLDIDRGVAHIGGSVADSSGLCRDERGRGRGRVILGLEASPRPPAMRFDLFERASWPQMQTARGVEAAGRFRARR